MILILTEETDLSSNQVCDWLHYLKKPFLRINHTENIRIDSLTLEKGNIDFKFWHENKAWSINDFSSIWYRRGWFMVEYNSFASLQNSILSEEKHFFEKFVGEEITTLLEFVYKMSHKRTKTFGNITKYNVNKLKMLEVANDTGLKTPITLITTRRDKLENFITKNGTVISKAIKENIGISTEKNALWYSNKRLGKKDIKKIPNQFQISLFQKYYEKSFEVRVFIFEKKTCAMTIFSQNNSKTQEDYRNYDHSNPTRCLPFILPKEVEQKIFRFMEAINLNTGSIDFICTPKNEFIFLEINPVGQFGMVSNPMNYSLEKDIAKFLAYE